MDSLRPIDTGGPTSTRAQTWRSAPESWAAALWLLVCVASLMVWLWQATAGLGQQLFALVLAVIAFLFSLRRSCSTWRAWQDRAALLGFSQQLLVRPKFAQAVKPFLEQKRFWFGWGFEWTPECAQRAYELTRVTLTRLYPPAWAVPWLRQGAPKDPEAIGVGAIHGVSTQENHLTVAEKTLEGGTLIVGTTQAGKGVLMGALVTQAILRGDAVIILDPKNSPRLWQAVVAACRLAGRPTPLRFHPGRTDSVAINPLACFDRTSELATRVTTEMPRGNAFTDFAWHAVDAAAQMLVELGEPVTLVKIREATNRGLMHLALRLIGRQMGPDALEILLQREKPQMRDDPHFILRLIEELKATGKYCLALKAVEDICERSSEYHSKVTASLLPVLAKLTTGPLRAALSPDAMEGLTLEAVIENRQVLYVALDSLPDPVVASTVGTMLLADLASLAGARYNRAAAALPVGLYVDECANVINRTLIEILNKGAESGIRTTCAMQTVSDLAARLGSDAEARMALGNFNNLIALRTKDRATQEFVSESFGRTYIASHEAAITSSSHSEDLGEFGASFTRRLTSQREEVVPGDLLGKLPNCEFFASLAGGRLVKGRVPILCDEPEGAL